MAHFILEYSANLRTELDVHGLFRALHGTVMATGIFPLGGIRFRAVRCDDYLVADGDPDNAFVHLDIRVGAGRTPAVRRDAAEWIFSTLKQFLQPVFDARPLAISMEMTELEAELGFRHNNIHDYLKKKES